VNDCKTIVGFDSEEVAFVIGNYYAVLYAFVELQGGFLGGDTERGRETRDQHFYHPFFGGWGECPPL
jgi:hypothetical protein